jgi:hypothetical protein
MSCTDQFRNAVYNEKAAREIAREVAGDRDLVLELTRWFAHRMREKREPMHDEAWEKFKMLSPEERQRRSVEILESLSPESLRCLWVEVMLALTRAQLDDDAWIRDQLEGQES